MSTCVLVLVSYVLDTSLVCSLQAHLVSSHSPEVATKHNYFASSHTHTRMSVSQSFSGQMDVIKAYPRRMKTVIDAMQVDEQVRTTHGKKQTIV